MGGAGRRGPDGWGRAPWDGLARAAGARRAGLSARNAAVRPIRTKLVSSANLFRRGPLVCSNTGMGVAGKNPLWAATPTGRRGREASRPGPRRTAGLRA